MTYPYSAGYAKGSDTSKAAAELLTGHDTLLYAVMLAVRNSNNNGLTVDEAKAIIENQMQRDFDRTTIGARFTELKERGYIEDSDMRRKSARGRMATVFKATIKGRDYILNS